MTTVTKERTQRKELLRKHATLLTGAYMKSIGITEWHIVSWVNWMSEDTAIIAAPLEIAFDGHNSDKDRFIYELHDGLESLHEYIVDNWSWK